MTHGADLTIYEILHVMLLEYIPFIILLLALFTVAGAIRLRGSIVGTSAMNSGFLLFGTAIASWMGTPGDRKSVVQGKEVSVRVDRGGPGCIETESKTDNILDDVRP